MLIATQLFVFGLYLPPVLKELKKSRPPQTIMSLSVHTAVWDNRAVGALVVLVAVQVSAPGLYLPPLPIAEAVGVGVGVGVNVPTGVNCAKDLPPASNCWGPLALPPQTIISLPLQMAVWPDLGIGALAVLVATQLSEAGLYFPPVFNQ